MSSSIPATNTLLLCVAGLIMTTESLWNGTVAGQSFALSSRPDVVGYVSGDGTMWGNWTSYTFCPPKTWATGYAMRVENTSVDNDDTAMNAIALYCGDKLGSLPRRVSPHNGYWGTWGEAVYCASSKFLTHFRLKVEHRLPPGYDDTSVNSISFRCEDGSYLVGKNGGPFGVWEDWNFPPNNSRSVAICGVRAKIERPQGEGDDTALNGLEFAYCRI